MSHPQPKPASTRSDGASLSGAASKLGYEIVDIAGFLDQVEIYAKAQTEGLVKLNQHSMALETANGDVRRTVSSMVTSTAETVQDVEASAALVRASGDKTKTVASWVKVLSERTDDVAQTLSDVRTNNQQIAKIANQVNTLAINAKIEAARAGDAGRGFAVVAEAINDLSRQTRDAAVQISENIQTLSDWIATLGTEAHTVSKDALSILDNAGTTDTALGRMETSILSTSEQAQRISEKAAEMDEAIAAFKPALDGIQNAVESTSSGIVSTHERVFKLIDTSEVIVQQTAFLDDHSPDAAFIRAATQLAASVSTGLEQAIDSGQATLAQVFDRNYQRIPGSDPEQFLTQGTAIMDRIMPAIQEPALQLDARVVFCAAVDVNGYLPTHNKKFSHPPSDDPVWNMGHCRNRRIFDDRVGLKAGRNTEPFLLQVYRRDMGGGEFKMMKDLSVPIFVKGNHWGGLRLAYSIS